MANRAKKVWWVNQPHTYLEEIKEHGKVAAVITSRNGSKLEHHENVMAMNAGDVVISNAFGKIIGVGRLINDPKVDREHLWQGEETTQKRPAYVAEVEYYKLKSPIATKQFRNEIQKLNIPGGPINSDCNVKQGYAFRFDSTGLNIIKRYHHEPHWPDWA